MGPDSRKRQMFWSGQLGRFSSLCHNDMISCCCCLSSFREVFAKSNIKTHSRAEDEISSGRVYCTVGVRNNNFRQGKVQHSAHFHWHFCLPAYSKSLLTFLPHLFANNSKTLQISIKLRCKMRLRLQNAWQTNRNNNINYRKKWNTTFHAYIL